MRCALSVALAMSLLASCAGPSPHGGDAARAPDERPLSQRTDAELTQMMVKAHESATPRSSGATSAQPADSDPPPTQRSARPAESPPPLEAAPFDTPTASSPGGEASPTEKTQRDLPHAGPRRSPAQTRADVDRYVKRLQVSRESADDAFRELWEVDTELVPDLILEVENRAPSKLRELKVLVADKEKFARHHVGLDPKGERFVYELPGMGDLTYDDIASGPARRGKSLKVVVKRYSASQPFTVGEALRAALLNRFRSSDYPDGDHRSDLVGWWQRYYEKIRSEL